MKKLLRSENQIFGMSNITPKRSGLSVNIWSDHGGVQRNVSHSGTPRVKISYGSDNVSISIEPEPEILTPYSNISESSMKHIQEGIDYVGRNYDLFLKHYLDTLDAFDDLDLFESLKDRGEFK